MAPDAEPAGGDLGAQVAERGFGKADIVVDDLPQRLVAATSFVNLQRTELQSLLVNFGRLHRAEADPAAADVHPMGAARRERHDLAAVKARRIDDHIVEMLPAYLPVVHDD